MKQILSFIIFGMVLLSQNSFASFTQAPEITLPGTDGEVRLEDLRGKVVYLDFWASWCKPCAKSFPWMREIKQRYADRGFEVLAVNLDKERKLADEFLSQMGVNFLVAFDDDGKSAADYKLKGMPSSYLIGRDGKVYASHIGFRDKDKEELEQAIIQLINK
jgi:thiol-disulfide isomerase/thioredoxin